MVELIAVVVSILLAGMLGWALSARSKVRRQFAAQAAEVTAARQAAEAAKKELETKQLAADQLSRTLEESTQRFDLVRKATSDMIYDLDIASGTLQWNDALHTTYGYNSTELVTTVEWWTSRLHPEDTMKLNETMNQLTDPAATDWQAEYRFRKADDSYVWVRDRSFIMRGRQGEPTHLIGAIRDISSEKGAA